MFYTYSLVSSGSQGSAGPSASLIIKKGWFGSFSKSNFYLKLYKNKPKHRWKKSRKRGESSLLLTWSCSSPPCSAPICTPARFSISQTGLRFSPCRAGRGFSEMRKITVVRTQQHHQTWKKQSEGKVGQLWVGASCLQIAVLELILDWEMWFALGDRVAPLLSLPISLAERQQLLSVSASRGSQPLVLAETMFDI